MLRAARRRKERTYPEISGRFGRARLVVLACEVGGRWSEETNFLLLQLAKAKVRGVLQPLKTSWLWRWRSILACAAAKAFAQSLLEQRSGTGVDGPTSSLSEVMSDSRDRVLSSARLKKIRNRQKQLDFIMGPRDLRSATWHLNKRKSRGRTYEQKKERKDGQDGSQDLKTRTSNSKNSCSARVTVATGCRTR